MKLLTTLVLFSSLLFRILFLVETKAAKLGKDGVYIVYLGAADSTKNDQAQLLSSFLSKRNKGTVIRTYRHGFSGFAAHLTAKEAKRIAHESGVVSVFPDPIFQLHTTRSWDFLKDLNDVVSDSKPSTGSTSSVYDTIIGVLDTGIWPESESFDDKDMGPIPSRWKGTCVAGHDFNSSNCNRKVIGARFYTGPDDDDDYNTPRDWIGHGSHVASTAAGIMVEGASYYGLASGTAKGGSPGSRIAVYSVCTPLCRGSSILSAFDDAIADGVDVISVSLGASSAAAMPEFKDDPIALGAFHAVESGITVVCSAGNGGPSSGSVVNIAPWIVTVAATTIDRYLESDVVLGGNKVIKGGGINFANIRKSPVNPIIDGKSAKKATAEDNDARECKPESLDGDKVKAKIVLCYHNDGDYPISDKKQEVQALGGIGLILVDDKTKLVASNYREFAMTVIGSKDAAVIDEYINSAKNPVATILPTIAAANYKPAPSIAYFSARGPSIGTRNILKPDIAAPGVDILAAWKANDSSVTPTGKDPPLFNIISGTSMSCPHVSGMAAVIKSNYPSWSPSHIKSAIMTTASQENNVKGLITTESGAIATAYDYGTGEMSTSGSLQPGLVYETTNIDYLNFLCYYGYDTSTIKIMSKNVPTNFSCPKESSTDLISNINYPSISVSNLGGLKSRNISRTLTNVVEDGKTTYTVNINAPSLVNVEVNPDKLIFTKNQQRLSYQVTFSATGSLTRGDVFGSITWTSGKFKVRCPFVVSN